MAPDSGGDGRRDAEVADRDAAALDSSIAGPDAGDAARPGSDAGDASTPPADGGDDAALLPADASPGLDQAAAFDVRLVDASPADLAPPADAARVDAEAMDAAVGSDAAVALDHTPLADTGSEPDVAVAPDAGSAPDVTAPVDASGDPCDPNPCDLLLHEVCVEGWCQCDDQCAVASPPQCAAGSVQVCEPNLRGCLDWSPPASCASGLCASATACAVAPELGVLVAAPDDLVPGAPTSVRWSWEFVNSPLPAPTCSIEPVVGAVVSGDSTVLTQTGAVIYQLTCANSAGFDTATATVTVNCDHRCPSAGATECSDGQLRSCELDAYACRAWGEYTACATALCGDAAACAVAPEVVAFAASPSSVEPGKASSVQWTWSYAQPPLPVASCAIEPQVGVVVSGASTQVTQTEDQLYTLTCQNSAGSSSATTTVTADCVDRCPGLDVTECSAGQLRTCVADSHGCLAWDTTPCAEGFCADATRCGVCAHQCDVVSAICNIDGVTLETCAADSNGCRVFSTRTCQLGCVDDACVYEPACGVEQCSRVPPTNQVLCYDENQTIDCASCGSYCGQDAQYPSNARTFTCYRANGSPQASCDAEADVDEVVTDSLTGLTWQRTWQTGLTWQQAVDHCAQLTYAGVSDWRLPSYHELASLVDAGRTAPAIDVGAFPGTPTSDYWTSSVSASSSSSAWWVRFDSGILTAPGKTNVRNARCVRGGPSYDPTGGARFSVQTPVTGQSVVTDAVTGLVWARTSMTDRLWVEALMYCQQLSYAGYTDWRLPDRNELLSLVDTNLRSPATAFSPMPALVFYSSSTYAGSASYAWAVDFSTGQVNHYMKWFYPQNARCVRGGP